ncbi:hypothetical protein ABVK25_002167 [Lepraria finkii]|uniref:Uncharacterized protein n=1 Tax=Lepraria finkii TaxID=1340010 RepID=A0ABR4BJD1_9LECA
MSIFPPRRTPANPIFLYPSFSGLVPLTARRHESSARRTTKRLRTKPDPSFTSPIPESQLNDHIVFNPPLLCPSLRTIRHQSSSHPMTHADNSSCNHTVTQTPTSNQNADYHPWSRTTNPTRRNTICGKKEIEEIRRLRTEDPYTWSRAKLAEKYGCSPFLVGMIAPNEGKKAEESKKAEQVKEGWGEETEVCEGGSGEEEGDVGEG